MKFNEVPIDTPDAEMVFIECDITGKTKKTRYGAAKKNVEKNNGKYITNWGLAKLNNPMKNPETKKKVKQTNLEKYGSAMPMNSKEAIDARREKFNDEEWKEQWVAKHKQTSLERYGVDHPMKLEETQNTQKATMQEKYGVDHPYQSKEIMDKMKANNLIKYGVENVASLPEVQVKMAKTTLERYGVEHYNELPEMKDYLREHCRDWLKESWENPWTKGTIRPEEWNKKQSETMAFLIATGQWRGGDKFSLQGWYQSTKCKKKIPMFRSSYELISHIHFDNNEHVEFYDYEPFSLPYTDAAGKLRLYNPGFIVKYVNDKKLHLIEVKSTYRSKAIATLSKANAAIAFCEENGLMFEIWLDDHIKSLGIDYKDQKWKNLIEYSKKKDPA